MTASETVSSKPVNVAVALSWDGDGAPVVTAKGRGEVAQRIADVAREHDVPIDDDPALVEVLAQIDIGCEIPEALFVAVAEIIAFAYLVRDELPGRLAAAREARRPGRQSPP